MSNSPGSTTCTACTAGSFQDAAGHTSCDACSPGSVSDTDGATTCTSCAPGRFQNQAGHTVCDACSPGAFQPGTGATSCSSCAAGKFQDQSGSTVCSDCGAGTYQESQGATTCTNCAAGTANPAPGSSSASACSDCAAGTISDSGASTCATCAADTYQPATGESACLSCSTCSDGTFTSAACIPTTDAVCSACDPSCVTCSGPGPNQCTSCPPIKQLAGGVCESLCGHEPDPLCQIAAKAQIQSNEKTTGKEKLQLQWKKVAGVTSRAGFGDPVTGSTIAVLCIFDDGGTLVQDFVIDRGGQTCGTKPCWRLKGKQGFAYQNKPGSADGIVKIGFVGGAAGKGSASAQGKNDPKKSFTDLPTGIAAALTGKTTPTIELVTNNGLCIGATMNKVQKDSGGQYKAQKK